MHFSGGPPPAGGGSVTAAAGDEIPEQHLLYHYAGFEAEVLSRSSRMGGVPLLREPLLRQLQEELAAIQSHFLPLWEAQGHQVNPADSTPSGHTTAAEVEFLAADGGRNLVFLQARPFTVRYSDAQL